MTASATTTTHTSVFMTLVYPELLGANPPSNVGELTRDLLR
jgi:hypothetical protein